MTNIELGALAYRAGFGDKTENSIRIEEFAKLKKFADAVAAKEREACADIAESKRHAPDFQLTSMPPQNGTAVDIANAIRARGEA